jgi:hypothetical protein
MFNNITIDQLRYFILPAILLILGIVSLVSGNKDETLWRKISGWALIAYSVISILLMARNLLAVGF